MDVGTIAVLGGAVGGCAAMVVLFLLIEWEHQLRRRRQVRAERKRVLRNWPPQQVCLVPQCGCAEHQK